MTRSARHQIATFAAILAMAIWIWAGIESVGHHHEGDADCSACSVATLPTDITVDIPEPIVLNSGTWWPTHEQPIAAPVSLIVARARDPPYAS